MILALSVIKNIGLLSLGALMLILLTQYRSFPEQGVRRQLLIGLLLGSISILVVAAPLHGPFGATFDTRAGPLVLAGYFAGPVGGLVAAALAAATRMVVGGGAAISGVISMVLFAVTGAVYAEIARRRNHTRQGLLGFLALSLIATAAALPAFFIGQPVETGLTVLQTYWPVLLIGNTVGVTMLGLIIEFLQRICADRDRYALTLRTSALARQAGGIGVWVSEVDTGKLTWDPVQHDLMGVTPDRFDRTRDAFLERVVPEDRDRVQAELAAAAGSQAPFKSLFRIRTPDGEVRYIRSHGLCVSSDGYVDSRRLIGVNIDVTREQELQSQVELNSAALDSAVCGVLIAEAADDYPTVYINSAFTEITGYRPHEVLGRNCRFLNAGLEDQPELDIVRRALATGEPCTVTLRNRRKDGTILWNTLNLSPIRDRNGDITHFIGVQDDVTEQVLARQVIAEGRDQIEAILAAAPDAILSVDSRQRITSFNDAAVRLFGWSSEEILGRSIHELVPVNARKAHVELVRNYIADPDSAPGPMSALRIVRARRKDGGSFPALISLARYQIGGEPMVTATAHDMSEIVQANEELVRLSDRLRDQLEEAYRANEAKDHFLAHMSHELRTPLNAIIGFADMLTTLGLERLGRDRSNEYVHDIKRSGEHLLSLINEILDLSKLKAGQVEATLKPTDAYGLIEEAVTTIGPAFTKKSIGLETDFRDVGTVLCDRRLALQCLLNLMSNAAKFSPEESRVAIRLHRDNQGVRFVIEDEGEGVPAKILDRVGEPFLRHDDPLTSNSQEGSGLGLAITKSLIEKQKGWLRIANGAKGGTVASIWLPSGNRVKSNRDNSLEVC
ncbi:PAS domain S-box protein [Thalassobaculum sp. OXR-137]|uniref:PAS domain-containing sensor histidine kinase n=1 Tax=Thalassobaculum sp. OXR-137 TaxID=3100173 RepID=UPI002AC97975|nr:PAS domain S-box protein [Thalassobaculum sp. OXR-137]WPZ35987.1 PAS domain S-box protein [Thalassobaculum sp. OXR-137]